MKLKTVTAISLFVFIAFFSALLVLPENFLSSINQTMQNQNQNTVPGPVNVVPSVDGVPAVVLSLEEIAKHNIVSDCYITINNSVYSVASFIDQHPGGRQKIAEMCGKEASKVFSAIHSNFAWNLLKDYFIGNVGSALNTAKVESLKNNPVSSNLSAKNGGEGEYEDENEYEDD